MQTEGSYFCTCKEGLIGDGGFSDGCIDENECVNFPCDENAVCENSFGSFKCTCLGGYTGDGFTCSDTNECLKNPCVDPRTCSNSVGSFSCSCTDSIGIGIKETSFEELTYLERPVNYDGVARENLPPQESRTYPGCTGIWGEFSSLGECSCETQTLIKARNCTTETPCDESYCDAFEDGICEITVPCETSVCMKSIMKVSVTNGEFELSQRNEISEQEFCDFLNEFKNLYCVNAIKCVIIVDEFSSEYTQC